MTTTDATPVRLTQKLLIRIFSKIQISTERFFNNDPCWEWTASKFPVTGYAQFEVVGLSTKLAHKVLYLLFVGSVPVGLVCDHLCKNPICVNPCHIDIVPQRINVLRGDSVAGQNMRKTHCIHGHPLFGDNLRLYRRKSGRMKGALRRICKTCVTQRAA